MTLRPTCSTRTDTLCPSTTLFRSASFLPPQSPPTSRLRAWRWHSSAGRRRMGKGPDRETPPTPRTRPASPVPARRRRRSAGKERGRSEEHTSELQSLMRNSYAVFCLKKKNKQQSHIKNQHN